MDEEKQQESAISLLNLSREGGAGGMLNGEGKQNGDINHDLSQSHSPSCISPIKPSTGLVGAAKRKSKPGTTDTNSNNSNSSVSALTTAVQTPLMIMAAQHGILPQQLQQFLQQQSPGSDLQMIMQQQSMLLQHQQQKLQEGLLHQLNEQLQVNFIQLSQLVQQQQQQQQQSDKKSSKQTQQQIQQLGVQQQQLLQQIQQIQLQQRQYLMACLGPQLGGLHQGMMSPGEIQQLWKEVAGQTGLDENMLKNNLNGLSLPTSNSTIPPSSLVHNPNFLTNGSLPVDSFILSGGLIGQPPISIKHNETPKPTSTALTENGTSNSTTSHPSSLLRHNYCKWPGCDTHCEDIAAFNKHLNSEHVLDDRSTAQARVQLQVVNQLEMQLSREKELLQGMMQHLHMKPPPSSSSSSSQLSPPCHVPTPTPKTPQQHHLLSSEPRQRSVSPLNQPVLSNHVSLPQLTAALPVTIPSLPLPSPTMTLTMPTTPTSQSMSSQPQTPTSAGPIRRRVSDKCNLPISAGISNEIQRNRDFYKNTDVRPPFTYASLIRQSIIESPHRQLTLNEVYQWFQNTFAYFRRNEATWKNAVRHNLSLHKCFMRVENVKGAVWTVDEIEFYRRRPQKMSGMKSPSYSDPTSFNESLNASLRAALGESSLSLLSANSLGQDSAEDLSMKSNSNSQEDLYREELMLRAIKQEREEAELDQAEFMDADEDADIDQSQERDGTFDQSEEREEYDATENSHDLSMPKSSNNGLDLVVDSHHNKSVNQTMVSHDDEEEEGTNPADEMAEDMGCFSLPRVTKEVSLPAPSASSSVV